MAIITMIFLQKTVQCKQFWIKNRVTVISHFNETTAYFKGFKSSGETTSPNSKFNQLIYNFCFYGLNVMCVVSSSQWSPKVPAKTTHTVYQKNPPSVIELRLKLKTMLLYVSQLRMFYSGTEPSGIHLLT